MFENHLLGTTSLSTGTLKNLAAVLALSSIGAASVAPSTAHAQSTLSVSPGSSVVVEEEINGISGNFENGGKLTVLNGGQSEADQLREAAGTDGIISKDDFFTFAEDTPNSDAAKFFYSLMGDKVNDDGSMNVDDILAVVPVVDAFGDLPGSEGEGMTRDEVRLLYEDAFGEEKFPGQYDEYLNMLTFSADVYGNEVFSGLDQAAALLRPMAENDESDGRYIYYALARIADEDGYVTTEKFKSALPIELFALEPGKTTSLGQDLLAEFANQAEDEKLLIGDAWRVTNIDSDDDPQDIDAFATFMNHAGSDMLLTQADISAAGSELGKDADKISKFWEGLEGRADEQGTVSLAATTAYYLGVASGNDFLEENQIEYEWNDNGRVTTDNVRNIVDEAFLQGSYHRYDNDEFEDIYVDPNEVINRLGTPRDDGNYDADDVYFTMLDVYMEAWQTSFDEGTSQEMEAYLAASGDNGRISVEEFISLAGYEGDTRGEAVRILLAQVADENGTISVFDATNITNNDDLIREIYTKTDPQSPVKVNDVLGSIPKGVSIDEQQGFAEALQEQAAEDGYIDRETAKEKLTEFVLENPGNELEQPSSEGNVLGANDGGIGIDLAGKGDLELNNEANIFAHDRGIVVSSEEKGIDGTEARGDVDIVNSGDIISPGDNIVGDGVNVSVANSGDLESYWNGIRIEAEGTANVENTGNIDGGEAGINVRAKGDITINNTGNLDANGWYDGRGVITATSEDASVVGGNITLNNFGALSTNSEFANGINLWTNGGDVTAKNSGDISTEGSYGRGIELLSGNSGWGEEPAQIGGNIDLKNSGNIDTTGSDSGAIHLWSNGGTVIGENTGDLTTSGDRARGITASSGNGRNSNDREAQKGGAVEFTNFGSIDTTGYDAGALGTWSNGGTVDLVNEGNLSTIGDKSYGIDVWSGTNRTEDGRVVQVGDDVSANNSGDIETSGANSVGLSAGSHGGAVDVINSGKINTSGDNSQAVSLTSGNSKTIEGREVREGGDITLTNNGALATEGANSQGLQAWTNGGDILANNTGIIETSGKESEGIKVESGNSGGDIREAQLGGTVTLNNSGAVTTAGEDANAVLAWSNGRVVTVDNTADLTTVGQDSSGIGALSGYGGGDNRPVHLGDTVKITNKGAITTSGDDSWGVLAFSIGDEVTVLNEGAIKTGGESSHGIGVVSGQNADYENYNEGIVDDIEGKNVSITNKGAIETSGEDAHNILGISMGGDITITNEADLSATGKYAELIAAESGIERPGENASEIVIPGGNIKITNSGNLVGSGEGTDGIEAESFDGGDVLIDNSGDITVTSDAIIIDGSRNGEIINKGNVTAKGPYSAGISVIADDTAKLTNSGSVDVVGEFGIGALGENSAMVINSGDVSLIRSAESELTLWNPAIAAYSAIHAEIDNTANVTSSGVNITGLFAGHFDFVTDDSVATNNAIIKNSGNVITNGDELAHAAFVKVDGEATIYNSGKLTTNGETDAIFVEGTGKTAITNTADGVIEAKNGLAIVTDETADTVINAGTIKGGADFASGKDELESSGILVGNFDFGSDDDTLKLSNLANNTAATFDGGADNDVAELSNGGAIGDEQFTNFETANLLSGEFSGQLQQFTERVNVSENATLSGFGSVNNLVSNGTVRVAAGETASVSGDLTVEGGQFIIGVDSTSSHGEVNVSGDALFSSTSLLFVTVSDDTTLTENDTVTALSGASISFGEETLSTAANAEGDFKVADDYISYDFSGRVEDTGEGKSLILTVRDSIGSVIEAVGDKYDGAVKFLANLSGDSQSQQNPVLAKIRDDIESGNTGAAQELAEEVVSSPGGSKIAATQNSNSFTAGNMVINRAAARIESGVSTGTNNSNELGYSADNSNAPRIRNIMALVDEGTETSQAATGYNGEVWMQVYGSHQESNGVVDSDADSYGGAAGIDFMVNPDTVIGLGLVYANSDANADTTNAHTDLETDSYGVTVYGMTRFAQEYRLGGALAYYWNDHDLDRYVLGNHMTASYDSNTFVARAELGRDFQMDGYTFTPQIGLIYTNTSYDGYTETGPLAQRIDDSSTESWIGTIGFSVASNQNWQGYQVQPEFHFNMLHEFNDELGSYSGALAGDNTVAVNGIVNSINDTRFNFGGSLKVNHTNAFSSELSYDGLFAEDTQEHLFRYKAAYKF